jgi:hypothetical protein
MRYKTKGYIILLTSRLPKYVRLFWTMTVPTNLYSVCNAGTLLHIWHQIQHYQHCNSVLTYAEIQLGLSTERSTPATKNAFGQRMQHEAVHYLETFLSQRLQRFGTLLCYETRERTLTGCYSVATRVTRCSRQQGAHIPAAWWPGRLILYGSA